MRTQPKWVRTARYASHYLFKLGNRRLTACLTALVAAILIFAASQVGVMGAVGGIVLGAISAVLMDPHSHPRR